MWKTVDFMNNPFFENCSESKYLPKSRFFEKFNFSEKKF